MKNVVLIGFMGTGKSVVGRLLAQRLGRPFVDVDALIEREAGRPIRKIFAEAGEPAFRDLERGMIQRVTQRDGQVIATGGGAVLDDRNVEALKRNGWLVWLKAAPDVILQRVGDTSNRPLLNVGDPRARVSELLGLREAFYAKADAVVDTSQQSVEQVADEILHQLPAREQSP